GARLPEKGQFDGQWLDERDPLQKAYVQANGHVINQDPYQYFTQASCSLRTLRCIYFTPYPSLALSLHIVAISQIRIIFIYSCLV
ncbi:hypothetical protein ONK29_25945, partial [Salmonella enterica subsp. enterica serovar Anatum]|nr:hypothetical protein [Salmonella enterica subsp. enterica serovar Anatum]